MEAMEARSCFNPICSNRSFTSYNERNRFCNMCGSPLVQKPTCQPSGILTPAKFIWTIDLTMKYLANKDGEIRQSFMETLTTLKFMFSFADVKHFLLKTRAKVIEEFGEHDNSTSLNSTDYMEISYNCKSLITSLKRANWGEIDKNMPEFDHLSSFVLKKCNMAHPKGEEEVKKFKRLFGLGFAAGYLAFLQPEDPALTGSIYDG